MTCRPQREDEVGQRVQVELSFMRLQAFRCILLYEARSSHLFLVPTPKPVGSSFCFVLFAAPLARSI